MNTFYKILYTMKIIFKYKINTFEIHDDHVLKIQWPFFKNTKWAFSKMHIVFYKHNEIVEKHYEEKRTKIRK